MNWVLIALILACAGYAVKILVDYLDCQKAVLPEIERLTGQAEQMQAEAETEAALRDETREKLPGLRERVGELERALAALREEVEAEQKLARRLQLAANRKEMKKRRRVTVG